MSQEDWERCSEWSFNNVNVDRNQKAYTKRDELYVECLDKVRIKAEALMIVRDMQKKRLANLHLQAQEMMEGMPADEKEQFLKEIHAIQAGKEGFMEKGRKEAAMKQESA